MIPHPLSEFIARTAPLAANHLWQSTLFALLAAALILATRKDQARVRFAIWLAASLKFLVPFSLLVALGNHLAPTRLVAPTALYSTVQQISQPFAATPSALAAATPLTALLSMLPLILAATWFIGFAAVLIRWAIRWKRIALTTRITEPVSQGREVDTLRSLEPALGIRNPIPFVLSRASTEPGVIGIRRPILVWPEGISTHLQPAHLRSILAHEIWHVRRRDNLWAALHMFVEAAFWFHPLVWWLGARLVDERERACDEAVLRLGNEPAVYAESILKTCRYCVEYPMPCVSGVTGSNLKKRILQIMTHQADEKLTLPRKLLLASVAVATIAAPITLGLLNAPAVRAQSPQADTTPYQLASLTPNHSTNNTMRVMITPEGFTYINASVKSLITYAYNIQEHQLTGGPGWIETEKYDLVLKSNGAPPQPGTAPDARLESQVRLAIQQVLANRFHLTLTQQDQNMTTYALTVAPGGSKLIEAVEEPAPSVEGPGHPHIVTKAIMKNGAGQMSLIGPTSAIADMLSGPLGRTVVDKTGLKGNYEVMLNWQPGSDKLTSIASAVQDQLGLQLVPQQARGKIFVIDRVEMP
jgi:bla regulator protein blaR1